MKKLILLLFIDLLLLSSLSGQEKILNLDEYLALVKRYHPISLQANLNKEKAFFVRLQAIGGFDPKLEIMRDQKVFNGQTYYDYLVPEVKLPLWYGIDLNGSYTSYNGEFVNPENKVPENGLSFLGLSFPLGKGLLIDERRAALKQASIYQNIAANEQQQMLNDLFVNAANTYIQWLNTWMNTKVYEQAVTLAQIRLNGTKQLLQNGDRPAIDTLEAVILLQTRQQKLVEYRTQLLNKKNDLAAYLWLDQLTPTDPSKIDAVPDEGVLSLILPDSLLNAEAAVIAAANPEVRNYGFKIAQLEVERRLKLEDIKPTLNFNLGVLNSGRQPFNNLNTNWLQNNQKFGFTFSMPLTFTKQRAAYGLAKIKIKEAKYEQLDKTNLVAVKWNNYRNELNNLEMQVKIHKEMVKNNSALLAGEEIKFKMGESSLFLLNTREQKLLETQEKLNEVSAKRISSIVYLRWISNNFY